MVDENKKNSRNKNGALTAKNLSNAFGSAAIPFGITCFVTFSTIATIIKDPTSGVGVFIGILACSWAGLTLHAFSEGLVESEKPEEESKTKAPAPS